MSKTVDEKVVEMRFDNSQFEKNVSTTMSTLEKFKQKLNLSGASKGLEEINSSAKRVDMSALGNGVETVKAKFSALEVMGVTALANLTNSAVNAGRRMISALSVDPIRDGFAEYETQMNAVQTILANTQSEGTNVKVVNKALDELNTYADKTIYNFTEMTRNIGTFTAAGVKLDTSVNAIKGIANLAAVSGSSSQQASTAMYQLSQALAAGKVQLQDWNSVVNAGMGGKVFQDALIRTSEHLKTGAKNAIKSKGSFRESLRTGWMTQEVLTQTLDQFATAADTREEYEAAVKKFVSQGYTKEEAKQMADMARSAGEAATKVKTFTQLIDTLKEALGSGWAQTWRLIIGDFEQAKTLWTDVSDVLSELINKSAEARNKMLKGWAKLGGRDDLIESFKNAFTAVSKIVKPISEAFRDIFPRTTAKQLYNITKGLKEFTERLIISDSTADKLKRTFTGVFSILDIGVSAIKAVAKGAIDLIKNLSGINIGILDLTASFGDWLLKLRTSIKDTDMFGASVKKITDFLSKGIDKLKEFSSSVRESLNVSDYEGIAGVLKGVWNVFNQVSSGIMKALTSVTGAITGMFNSTNIFEVINNGLLTGILIYIGKFVKSLSGAFDSGAGVLSNIKGILTDVRECFQAYQKQLKAEALKKIATAIAILAGAIFVISTIDGDALSRSLGGITVLFGELLGSLAIFDKMNATLKGSVKAIPLMIGMSLAVLILSGAMKKLASLDWQGIGKGLTGVGALLTELSIFLRTFKFEGKLTGVAFGIIGLSVALIILSKAVNNFGGMSWEEIGKGLASVGALLTELALFTKFTGGTKKMISIGAGMVLLGASMKIFASAMKDFGKMSWSEIGKGLAAMGGALLELSIAMRLLPKNTLSVGLGLVVVASSIKIMYSAISDFSGMSWDEIGRGLTVMGGALLELSIALNLMKGTLSGSAALLIAAVALSIITPVLKALGSMSWEAIGKGLISLAGAFAVIGIAGALLSPIIPAILGLSAAFALLGVASLGIGAGLVLIAAGIGALSTALSVGVTAIVAGLSAIIVGIADLIPTIAAKLGEGIVEFAKVIGVYAPQLATSFLQLIVGVLDSLVEYTPRIVDSLLKLLIGVINSLADNMPELVKAAVNLIGSFLQGVIEALNGIDTTNLIKTIVAVGMMSALMYALSAIVPLIPSAMAGVLGLGVVVAEIGAVVAAIGALAQIPGFGWLVEEGGNFLQKIGTAIGQFVGGIIGGVAKGATSALPEVATNLSNFMNNIKPFIDGATKINPSMLSGVDSLVNVILKLTAADLLSSITSWVTGGSSLTDFADQLVPFGKSMSEYAKVVSGIDPTVVTASANAAKTLAELANNLPNSGGMVSWFTGDNEIGDFAKQLKPFGKAMNEYSKEVSGINPEAVTASANAAKSLSELSKNLPNSGGMVSWFTGENNLGEFAKQLKPFGEAMSEYSKTVKSIDPETVTASANAAKTLAELANNLPNSGGMVSWFTGDNTLDEFGAQLKPFGEHMSDYAETVKNIKPEAVIASANAAKSLSELANNLPNSGGLVSWFTGDNGLQAFGDQLAPFGRSMKAYSDIISGVKPEAVNASTNAARLLSELANNLPNSGGMVSWFTGENNLGDFAEQLKPFGKGMKAYSDSVSGINVEAVNASTKAARSIVDISKTLQNGGGLVSLFTGDSSLEEFGNQLSSFGRGIKKYGNAVVDLNTEAIINSSKAARALVNVANALNKSGGALSVFAGDTNLSSFGDQLVPFGRNMKKYGNAVVDLNSDAIVTSAKAASALVKVANTLHKSGGAFSIFTGSVNLTTFGNQLVPFGRGMKKYGNTVAGTNVEAITKSVSAAKSFIKVAKAVSNSKVSISGNSNISSIGSQLISFGKSIKKYSNAVNGINANSITSSATAAKKLVSLIKSMSGIKSGGVSGFKKAIDDLAKTNIKGFVKAFSDLTPKMVNNGSKLSKSLAKGFKSNQSVINSAVTSVVNKMQNIITKNASKFDTAGKNLANKLSSGFSNGGRTVSKSIRNTLSECVAIIRSYRSRFYNAGSYVVSGFASGISSNSFKAKARARAMAKAAYDAAKKALDINSPSKVFRRLGYSVPEGFAQGIDRMGKYVSKSSLSMAKTAINGTNDALSRMADIINGDSDVQPTIRPVLDLTDVKHKAGTISGMFNSVGLNANVDAISALMSSRVQNGSVNDSLLDEIKGLRGDLALADTGVNVAVNLDYKAGADANQITNDIAKNLRRVIRRG